MSRANEIAKKLARALIKLGDHYESPCQRIQFMCGEYPDNEIPAGGMCEEALVMFFERLLATELSKEQK
jgi:hypothetical protein